MSKIQKVGVIGAGTMGNGIAQACAVSGIDVVMVDVADAAVKRGVATITTSLDRLLKKDKIAAGSSSASASRRIRSFSSRLSVAASMTSPQSASAS